MENIYLLKWSQKLKPVFALCKRFWQLHKMTQKLRNANFSKCKILLVSLMQYLLSSSFPLTLHFYFFQTILYITQISKRELESHNRRCVWNYHKLLLLRGRTRSGHSLHSAIVISLRETETTKLRNRSMRITIGRRAYKFFTRIEKNTQ